MKEKKKTSRHKQTEMNRQLILEAAQKLFSENGYDQTAMRDICNESQLPMGSLYYHFKNKDDMLLAICVDIAKTPEETLLCDIEEKIKDPYPHIFRYLDEYGDVWAHAGEVFSYNVYRTFEYIYEQEHTWQHVPFYQNLLLFIKRAQEVGTFDNTISAADAADYLFMMVRALIYEWSQTKARHENIYLCEKYLPRLLHTFMKGPKHS